MGYALDFGWLEEAVGAIANGAAMTVFLIAVTSVLGIVLSILGAAARRSRYRILRSVISAYVEVIRNTPFLVQLFFIFFGLPRFGIRLDPVVASMLAMTLNMTAYTIEIVGAGLDATALGLRPIQVFIKVVLPQALKVIFPALTSQIVIMMLESSVVSQIAVRELTYEADMLQARTFRAFETYFIITLVYLGLSIGLRRLLFAAGRKMIPGGMA
jgi:polar amino acid transport system permease protein